MFRILDTFVSTVINRLNIKTCMVPCIEAARKRVTCSRHGVYTEVAVVSRVTIDRLAQILQVMIVCCDIAIILVAAIVWSEEQRSIEPDFMSGRPREAQLLRLIATCAQQEREVTAFPKPSQRQFAGVYVRP